MQPVGCPCLRVNTAVFRGYYAIPNLGGVIITTNRKQDDGGLHLLNVHTGTKLMRPPARANYIEQR